MASAAESLVEHPELAEASINEANRLAQQLAVPLGGLENGFEGLHVAPVRLSMWEKVYRNYREFQRSFDRTTLLKTKVSRLLKRLGARNGAQPQEETHSQHRQSDQTADKNMIRVKKCRDPWEFPVCRCTWQYSPLLHLSSNYGQCA